MVRAFAVLVGLAACVPYDPGGVFGAHQHAEIRGVCLSSCAASLATARCISPDSLIGVHEVREARSVYDYDRGRRSEFGTAFLKASIPACARSTFPHWAFAGPRLALVAGRTILRACPRLAACR
jgi:hypothetical protein